MATRTAEIAPGALVDLTAALSLESGQAYAITLDGPADESVRISLGADPDAGAHVLEAGETIFVAQGATSWMARLTGTLAASATMVVATCAE